MNADDLHACATERSLELPGSVLDHPFGPDMDVWKVRGKMFLFLHLRNGAPMVTLKSDPEIAAELRRSHSSITPGYHMNKRHWISITAGDSITLELLRGLVTDSYLAVVEKLPRAQRPVDPFNFG
ncbi:MmcQ/YjbR family DNA-binding protein [Corynebacterium sp. A21]|uniref:MmcQ/YjbR family DNA-binding protein n=1 Tax=Corynebacterium sp. A21 TaxID=3457318 RepID=UPI003FD24611